MSFNIKIYKIWSPLGDKVYIGSTSKELSQRMKTHIHDYKKYINNKHKYITSFILFNEYGLNNCYIELLEIKECISKIEINQLEGKYIKEYICVNKIIPGQTRKEHAQNKKTQHVKLNEYTVQLFLNECCVVGPDKKIMTSEAKKQYNNFCKNKNMEPLKQSQLKEYLLNKNFKIVKNSNDYYHGFSLNL
jgi:hypothetical protein